MKRLLRRVLNKVRLLVSSSPELRAPAGSSGRGVGNMKGFLEDIRARGVRAKLILDVGANNGHWSTMAAEVFPEASFVLIEPQAEMKPALVEFTRRHRGVYYMVAAGAGEEARTLTIWDDLMGSSLMPSADAGLLASGKQREVQIIPIDVLLERSNLGIPELIKLDIQGFELEALKGAGTTFGVTEVYILETSLFPFSDVPGTPIFQEVVNFMADKGYVVYDFAGFLRRPSDGALGQCDICFVKKDGILRRSNAW
jgi:FkbM family methyltransferase